MSNEYYIGTSGWSYRHWYKKFYPEDLPKKDWFAFFTRNYRTVEINYSFYRWPAPGTLDRWYETTPEDFRFTLKAPKIITHSKQLKDTGQQVEDFYQLSERLKEKMACHFYQLPPQFTFQNDHFDRLKNFLKLLDRSKENVIEFRHHGWWNKEVYDLLNEYQVAFCIVYGLKMPDTKVLTTDFSYWRFHGERYNTRYSVEEIHHAAELMRRMNARKHYVYFNNDGNAYAIYNSKELITEVAAAK